MRAMQLERGDQFLMSATRLINPQGKPGTQLKLRYHRQNDAGTAAKILRYKQ